MLLEEYETIRKKVVKQSEMDPVEIEIDAQKLTDYWASLSKAQKDKLFLIQD